MVSLVRTEALLPRRIPYLVMPVVGSATELAGLNWSVALTILSGIASTRCGGTGRLLRRLIAEREAEDPNASSG